MGKRVLIVDDEKSVVFFLGENLAELGPGYRIETACSGEEALAKIAAQPFDLVITDLRMPGVNGLELLESIRATHPNTQLILMTAYGSDRVEVEARRLAVYRYITKPFLVEDLVEIARQALSDMAVSGQGILILSDERFAAITRRLSDLRVEISAQCIILADVMGQLITRVGITEGVDVNMLISLIGGGFATTFEVARYLGQTHALNLNYQEGSHYDVYSSNVGDNLILAILYSKDAQTSRIGTVWLYTKRAIKDLIEITATAETVQSNQVLGADFGALLSDSLDQFLAPGAESSCPTKDATRGASPTLQQATAALSEPTADLTAFTATLPDDPPADGTLSLEQALQMGLLSLPWQDAEDTRSTVGDVPQRRFVAGAS